MKERGVDEVEGNFVKCMFAYVEGIVSFGNFRQLYNSKWLLVQQEAGVDQCWG